MNNKASRAQIQLSQYRFWDARYGRERPRGHTVQSSPWFFGGWKEAAREVALAAGHAIPVVFPWREYVDAGGLMSYGSNLSDAHSLIGVYIGKILRGASPADLPVEQITKGSS